ncbi:MAG: glutathione binding-like protein [Afipia sp.]|jgi:glutathione S-transferase|nr:glutathione binding-like protein [Afipia sp.]
MELYFKPLACSMATRIALYEAGADAAYFEVDPKTKLVQQNNTDFVTINPLGMVPALRTDDGDILTENAAILQHVADSFPDAKLNGQTAQERSRIHQWLCFIGTELHKSLFNPLLDPKAPSEMKKYVLEKNLSLLDYLNKHLAGREYLLNRFTVADAYLFTVLNWSMATPQIDIAKWPNVMNYRERLRQRPSIVKAFGDEFKLYQAEQARNKAA